MESIEITDRGAAQIDRGALWIFSNEIFKKPGTLTPGQWCQFRCRAKMVGTGYLNPHSLIFGRILSREGEEDIEALLRKRIAAAFARRPRLLPTGAARLIYSEADIIPGLVVDVYADNAVVQSNTAGIDTALPLIEKLLPALFEQTYNRPLKGLVIKADAGIRALEGVENFTRVVLGDPAAMREITFDEDGTLFSADLIEGQKTGFFLDQRDNRRFLGRIAPGRKRVLDLCSYSGGWGLRALKAGVELATFVDESAEALKLVEKGMALNNIDAHRTRLVKSDVFDFLEKDEDFYDVIVADPPAFVKSKKNLPQAKRAYEKLNRLAWRRLKHDGVLISCSCSYHLAESEFLELLEAAVAKEKGFAHVIYRGQQASDHPYLLSMPETNYLKCAALQNIHVSD